MATLYKRATPPQRRVLRIVEGAVKNACDAHQHRAPHNFARSVAKRAAGTLTAQWPDVLAADWSSDRAMSQGSKNRPARAQLGQPMRKGAAQPLSRTLFNSLYRRIGAMAGFARKAGNNSRAAALADALRVIANLEAEIGAR